MSDQAQTSGTTSTWFVGASANGNTDLLPRFLNEGIWENGYLDRHLDVVRSMRPGDRIAVKASYTRKKELPFDNRGQSVSVMAIKAVGTITDNLGDGRRVRVDWKKVDPIREWYFYTHRGTVWHVEPGKWETDALLAFTFEGKPQEFERFCNAPYWKERFGTQPSSARRFVWTSFYESLADKLLIHRNDRSALVAGIQRISERVDGLGHLGGDRYRDGHTGFVKDICPFTTMGLFNRGTTIANRRAIAQELATLLGVTEPVPESFESIPLLNNMRSWFFPHELERDPNHIDSLWDVFAAALSFADADSGDEADREAFAVAFDNAIGRPLVAWNLTCGLYWVRPWTFPSLDQNSRAFIKDRLGTRIGRSGPGGRCSARDYLALMDALQTRLEEPDSPVHSYPELSLNAWQGGPEPVEPAASDEEGSDEVETPASSLGAAISSPRPTRVPYGVGDILSDGCFLGPDRLERLLERLRTKKNLILQGPPGTGKTWVARRLAFALMGEKDEKRLRAVQFHPNLSYEDFVRGWRPKGDGKLALVDGVFMEAIRAARNEPDSQFVVLIEEINRGNPAQIFGELLTLLEATKRIPEEALELSYPDEDGTRRPLYIPPNLYVLGTMNVADRSLAMVDLALRRRFAFADLEPELGERWRQWMNATCGLEEAVVTDIARRIQDLNDQISADSRLGKQFRIGHSYVTHPRLLTAEQTQSWFRGVVETEIGPLLNEYWFDAPSEADKARDRLLQGW